MPPIPDSVWRQKQKQDQIETQKQKQTQKENQKQNTGATEKAMPVLESLSSATEPESGSGDEDLLVTSLAGACACLDNNTKPLHTSTCIPPFPPP